jgi:hypothetical protein
MKKGIEQWNEERGFGITRAYNIIESKEDQKRRVPRGAVLRHLRGRGGYLF